MQVNALIGVSTVLLIVGIFAVWANRLLFSPDNWSKTSTALLQSPNVRTVTANYLVNQLYAKVDVPGELKAGLPDQLQGLAGPAAGALRGVAVEAVERALALPRVQDLWARANHAADQAFVHTVNGGNGAVGVRAGEVSLNLGAILDNVASRFGLSANLGPNAANVTILRSKQLRYVQVGGKAIKGLALWLTILVGLLYLLAVWLARGNRRRTLMTVGFSGILAGVVVLFARTLLVHQIPGSLTNDASLQPAVKDVISIATSILVDTAGACVLCGAVLVAAAWFAGPAQPAYAARKWMAPFLRAHHLPAIGITLGALLLLFIWDPIPATGKPAGIIVFTLLALLGTEVLIRQTDQEFPVALPATTVQAGSGNVNVDAQSPEVKVPAEQ
jgi:hypothetical protein